MTLEISLLMDNRRQSWKGQREYDVTDEKIRSR